MIDFSWQTVPFFVYLTHPEASFYHSFREDDKIIHKYLPSLEGGWPPRQGASRILEILGVVRIERSIGAGKMA